MPRRTSLLSLAALVVCPAAALAGGPELIRGGAGVRIPELRLDEEVKLDPGLDVRGNVNVTLTGELPRRDLSLQRGTVLLLHGAAAVAKASKAPKSAAPAVESRAITLKLTLTAPEQPVELVSVDAKGKVFKEKLIVRFEDLKDYKRRILESSGSVRPWTLTPSLGVSAIGYEESGVPAYSSMSATAKVSGGWAFATKPVSLGVTIFLTALPLTASVAGTAARFLGVNLRAGYTFARLSSRWRLTALGGTYYTTMFVTGDAFGFRNLMGPQLFPTVSYELPGGDSLSAYLKFSPVGSNFKLESLSNRELALGAGYVRRLRESRRTLSVNADWSHLDLTITGVAIRLGTFSLSVGYGL